jgi:DNA-binding CsgD family transcriptional regulator
MDRQVSAQLDELLTPREREVLALIRRRYTNRGIAEELGISLSGAKHHVSEIITKLGVSTREEAATWRPETQKRWSMASLLSSLSTLSGAGSSLLLSKAKVAVLGPLLVFALAAGGYGATKAFDGGSGLGPAGGGQGGAAPNPCATLFTYQCVQSESQDFNTLEEAVAVASFEPAVPAYVPEGFEPIAIRHTRPEDFSRFIGSESFKEGCPGCDPRMSHNDQIGIYYRDTSGSQLAIVQGFPAYLPFHESAPEGSSGTVRISDREAYWVRGLPGRWDEPQTALYLDLGRVGTGWEVSPDKSEVLYGSPISYSITSNALSLEELVKIAESVSFE